jgi:hypothetical protein
MRRAGLPLLLVFAAGLAACGDASLAARDSYAAALESLAAGRPAEALRAADRVAASEDADLAAFGDFLAGNASFALSEEAERESSRPGADPTLADRSLAHAEDALSRWRRAILARGDWPEARRNAERALLRLERLRERAQESRTRRIGIPRPGESPEAPTPPEPTTPRVEEPAADGAPSVETREIAAEQVARILEVLRKKEQEKRELRRRRATDAGSTEDW